MKRLQFGAEKAQRIHESEVGSIWQTRRVTKPQPPTEAQFPGSSFGVDPAVADGIKMYSQDQYAFLPKHPTDFELIGSVGVARKAGFPMRYRARFKVGDLVAVTEPWRIESMSDGEPIKFSYRDGSTMEEDCESCDYPGYEKWNDRVLLQLDQDCKKAGLAEDSDGCCHWDSGQSPGRWYPARFMPAWASRTPVKVVGVRAERLQSISESDIDAEGVTEHLIANVIRTCASRYKVKDEHWIAGDDSGYSYCYECCEKQVKKLNAENPDGEYEVDGGWDSEGDSQPFCETCKYPLSNSYTTYCCEEEVRHFSEYGFDPSSPADCYSLERILGSVGFLDDSLTPAIKRFGWQSLWNSIHGKGAWDRNEWVFVYTIERGAK